MANGKPIDNMQIWNAECTTPSEWTKSVGRRGGFTGVDAQYQLKRATERWGTYGDKWGINIQSVEFVTLSGGDIIAWMQATFFYPSIVNGERIAFDMINDMLLKPDDNIAKKLLTSLRSKALSCLGFSSDVYEGLYDDDQYLADEEVRKNPDAHIGKFETGIRDAKTVAALGKLRKRVEVMHKHKTIRDKHLAYLLSVIAECEKRLANT